MQGFVIVLKVTLLLQWICRHLKTLLLIVSLYYQSIIILFYFHHEYIINILTSCVIIPSFYKE